MGGLRRRSSREVRRRALRSGQTSSRVQTSRRDRSETDGGGRSQRREFVTVASVVVALTGVGVTLWVGKTTSDVADETRRDAIVAQRVEQFSSATAQLASPAEDVQLGAVYSLESLVLNDPETYGSRGCDMIRAFIDSRAVRTSDGSAQMKRNSAVSGALNVAGRACQGRAGMEFKDLLLSDVRIPGATFTGLSLPAADLSRADLEGSNLDGTKLRGALLANSALVSASIVEADLSQAVFIEAQLREANLSGSDLSAAKFDLADLTRAGLRNVSGNSDTELVGARMAGADLRGAHLPGVVLRGADLRGADLGNANLARSDLRGARLAAASLAGTDLFQVRYDANTVWPEGYSPPNGPESSAPRP